MAPSLSGLFSAVPAYYALILRSLTVLEGLALYADPNFKVLAASYPYFAKRLLTDPNPYLRDALIELLFKDGKFRHVFTSVIIYLTLQWRNRILLSATWLSSCKALTIALLQVE